MYGKAFDMTEEQLHPDYVLPIGKAKVEKEGRLVIFISNNLLVKRGVSHVDIVEDL